MLGGKALTFQFPLGPNKIGAPVSGQTAPLVGSVATPVIPATGTQGGDKNYGITKRQLKVVKAQEQDLRMMNFLKGKKILPENPILVKYFHPIGKFSDNF